LPRRYAFRPWRSAKSEERIMDATPIRKPITAGKNAMLPSLLDYSMAGIIRLKTAAAIITPPANADIIRSMLSDISPRIKNTQHPPATVPMKGIKIPITV
jgi:hypothetical protein